VTKLIVAFGNFATAPKNETRTVTRRHNSPNFVLYISGLSQQIEESDRQDNPTAVLEFVIGSKRNRGLYRGADKSLARPTSRCTRISFDGENISFDASLVLYI
jgi:hypothetical protein